MKKIIDQFFQLFTSLSPNKSFKYEILFMVSVAFYNSLDYFLQNSSSRQQLCFWFLTIKYLQHKSLLGIFLAILFLLNGFIIFQLFVRKKANFAFQILEKIIFPIQVWTFIRLIKKTHETTDNQSEESIMFLKVFLTIITIVSLLLILLKNFKFKYFQSLERNFNRTFQGQIILILLKLGLSLIYSLFFPTKEAEFLICIGLLNIILNGFFVLRIFYQSINIEFIGLVSHFYIWIPLICQILKQYDVQSLSVTIVHVTTFIVYLIIGISKPKCVVCFLQAKYLNQLSRMKHNVTSQSGQGTRLKIDAECKIAFLSILRTISLGKQKVGIQWSSEFKFKICQLIQQLIDLKKLDRSPYTHVQADNNVKNLSANQIFLKDQQSFHEISFENILVAQQKIKNQRQNHQLNQNYWKIVDIFLDQEICRKEDLAYFVCYNSDDSTQISKQRLLYTFYSNIFYNDKSWLSSINRKFCYSFLLERMGFQTFYKKFGQCPVLNSQNCEQQYSSKNIGQRYILRDNGDSNKFQNPFVSLCLEQQKRLSNPNFNQVVQQNELLNEILLDLNLFKQNEENYLYMIENRYDSKQKIVQYIQKRNSLRTQIQFKIKEYWELLKNQNKFFIYVVLRFLKDYWLNNNPLIAYDNLKNNIQKLYQQNKDYHPKGHQQKQIKQQNENSMNCVISAIETPNCIQMASYKFKQLLQLQQKYSSKQTQNYHKIPINTLLPGIWQQAHDKILQAFRFSGYPCDHLENRYFMISHKKSNALEVKFQMYYHMLYEKDFFIIMDMRFEKLDSFVVMNQTKNQVLYRHIGQKDRCTNQQEKLSQSRRKYQKVKYRDCQWKQDNQTLRLDFLQIKDSVQLTTNLVTVFGFKYQIHANKQPSPIQNLSQQQQIISRTQQLRVLNNCSLLSFRKEQKLQQLRFHDFRENFSDNTCNIIWMTVILIVMILFLIVGFKVVLERSKQSLVNQLYLIDDKDQLEVKYHRQQLNRAISLGMLSNIVSKQIDISLLQPQMISNLFSHILTQITSSISSIIARHKINPFITRNKISNEWYFQYNWIKRYNISFQMNSYRSQMIYLQSLSPYVKIEKLNNSWNARLRTANEMKKKNPFSTLELYKASKFINQITFSQQYYGSVNGDNVPKKFSQNQIMFVENENIVVAAGYFTLLIVFLAFNFCLMAISLKIAAKIVEKYEVGSEVSHHFQKSFKQSTTCLNRYLFQLRNFSKDFIDQILQQKKPSSQQINSKKQYTVYKSNLVFDHHSTKRVFGVGKYSQELDQRRNQKQLDQSKQSRKMLPRFARLYFDVMKYSIIRLGVICTILLITFSDYKVKSQKIRTYSNGLQQLSMVNMGILNLMSTNMFLSTLKSPNYSSRQYSEQQVQIFVRLFEEQIKQVSSMNKIKIVKSLFLDKEMSNQQMIPSALFSNLCVQYADKMLCPTYMTTKVNGLLEKYGQTSKNVNVLFHKLMHSNNTTGYQIKYIDCYQNINELLFLALMIRKITLQNLQNHLNIELPADNARNQDSIYGVSSYQRLIILVAMYLLFETALNCWKVYGSNKVVESEFLKIGSWLMYKRQKHDEGYGKYFNLSQNSQFLLETHQM